MQERSLISKYRGPLMGLAILWIVFYHAPSIGIMGLKQLQDIGYAGVEIFLLLSSYGLYYSLNRDDNKKRFYKKRLSRILPAYIPALLLRIIWDISNSGGIRELLSPHFLWHHVYFLLWFVPYIVVLYLLSPLYIWVFKKNPRLVTIIAIFFAFVMSFVAWGKSSLFIATARTPVFLLGFYIAHCDTGIKGKVEVRYIIIHVLAIAVVYGGQIILISNFNHQELAECGLMWFPLFFGTYSLVRILSIGLDLIHRTAAVSVLKILGKITLEIYLFHQLLYDIISRKVDSEGWMIYIVAIILTLVVALFFNRFEQKIKGKEPDKKDFDSYFVQNRDLN